MAQTLFLRPGVQREHGKQRTVVLLRWVLIIAFSYLVVLAAPGVVGAPVVVLIALALASNLVIARLPQAWAAGSLFDIGVVLFDAAWVTLGLAWAPHVSSDLVLLYFLVIFVAATGESLPMIVCSAAVVSAVYGASLSLRGGSSIPLSAGVLLRVPFLFVVALFYGYFVGEIRSRKSEVTEARVRDQAKSELLAAVSHDLRSPLANAEGLLDLLLVGAAKDAADERSLLIRTQVNVRRMSALVANLLQAACIEAGQVRLQLGAVQLNDVAEDVMSLESGAASLKEIQLSASLSPELPAISGDFVQMGRIAVNLVSNAIKYTPTGGMVTIRTACDATSVRLQVEDNGPGMSAEQCDALFAPYRRVHIGGYTPGTGLGLYIVKRLTEAQGGAVSVSSSPGVGSTFTVSFPRRAPASTPEVAPQSQARAKAPAVPSVRPPAAATPQLL